MRKLLLQHRGHVLPGQRVVETMAVPFQPQLSGALDESTLKTATPLESVCVCVGHGACVCGGG